MVFSISEFLKKYGKHDNDTPLKKLMLAAVRAPVMSVFLYSVFDEQINILSFSTLWYSFSVCLIVMYMHWSHKGIGE